MKRIYSILGLAIILLQVKDSFSQSSFKFYLPDTIVYAAPKALGDTSCEGDYILNKTTNALTIDVVRVQDVDIAGSGWTSAFCLALCYPDFIDSVRYTIPASDTVDFIPHFYFTATPDSQTVYYKIKNVGTPTDVVFQRFYGITKVGVGIHEYGNLANVSMYPSPIVAGNNFSLNISNLKVQTTEISLVVYNIYGSVVRAMSVQAGNNSLNLPLAPGLYSYSLVSGDVLLRSGKFTAIK